MAVKGGVTRWVCWVRNGRGVCQLVGVVDVEDSQLIANLGIEKGAVLDAAP